MDSDEYKKAMNMLSEVGLNSSFLIPNELLDGYVRVPIVEKDAIKNISVSRNIVADGKVLIQQAKVNEKEIETLEAIWNLYTTDSNAKEEARVAFMQEWNNYPSLKKLRTWWDALPVAFDITQVGTVLAHTNARRCDKNIPELPL